MSTRKTKTLTKSGAPRKRAPGAGRPETGRNIRGPKISAGTRSALERLAKEWGVSGAEALERAVSNQVRLSCGIMPQTWGVQGD